MHLPQPSVRTPPCTKPRFPEALRARVIFGTIEGLTPVIGWLLGRAAAKYVTAWDHWIALTLLGLLGRHMIYAGLKPESEGGATDATKRRHGFWSRAATGPCRQYRRDGGRCQPRLSRREY